MHPQMSACIYIAALFSAVLCCCACPGSRAPLLPQHSQCRKPPRTPGSRAPCCCALLPRQVSYAIKQAAVQAAVDGVATGKAKASGRKRARKEAGGSNGAAPANGAEWAAGELAAAAAEVVLAKTSPVVLAKVGAPAVRVLP